MESWLHGNFIAELSFVSSVYELQNGCHILISVPNMYMLVFQLHIILVNIRALSNS